MEEEVNKDETENAILWEEFDRALKGLSRNKAPEVDDILSELLILLGERSHDETVPLGVQNVWDRENTLRLQEEY